MTHQNLSRTLILAHAERCSREQRWGKKFVALHARGATVNELARVYRTAGFRQNNSDDLNSIWWMVATLKHVNRTHRAGLIRALILNIKENTL